jgi:hypothetical protein
LGYTWNRSTKHFNHFKLQIHLNILPKPNGVYRIPYLFGESNKTQTALQEVVSLVIQLPIHKHRKKGLAGDSERLGC